MTYISHMMAAHYLADRNDDIMFRAIALNV